MKEELTAGMNKQSINKGIEENGTAALEEEEDGGDGSADESPSFIPDTDWLAGLAWAWMPTVT